MLGSRSGLVRLGHAVAFAVTTVAVTVVTHVAAGGTRPAPGLMAALVMGMSGPAVWLTARRRPVRLVAAVLAGVQFLLHGLLSVVESPGVACAVHGSGHLHGGASAMHCTTPTALVLDGHQHHGWLMLVGHAGATIALAWLLAHGQAAFWRLVDWVLWRIPRPGARLDDGDPGGVRHAPQAPHPRVGGSRHGSRAPPRDLLLTGGLAAA